MKLEVYEGTIPGRTRSKYAAINSEILETLLRVKAGSSVRVEHPTYGLAISHAAGLKKTIKNKKLQENYFVAAPRLADNGKFYVYIGHKR